MREPTMTPATTTTTTTTSYHVRRKTKQQLYHIVLLLFWSHPPRPTKTAGLQGLRRGVVQLYNSTPLT